MTPELEPDSKPAASPIFATTLWSVVLKAGDATGQHQAAALETLCRLYWYPLYAFARRQGKDPEAAKDLTQGFFEHLLATNLISRVDRAAGKFRTYLLASFKNFIGQDRIRANAMKRGGGEQPISIDAADAETRYALEPVDGTSPDRIFERRCALAYIERSLERLEAEMRADGKGEVFARLQGHLIGESGQQSYRDLGKDLGQTEGALRTFVSRLRSRFRELVRDEVAQTVSTEADLEEEMRCLAHMLAQPP